ncbi:MAG: DUF6272 family protein [Bacteroidota bacterium]|nr:DUF6272 family protein [Bacteroidota bacterium]
MRVEDKMIINLNGNFNHNTVLKVIDILEKNNNLNIISDSELKKLINISIELIENNNRYVSSLKKKFFYESKPSKFRITKIDNIFVIESGNTILVSDKEKLENRFKHVNSLNIAALKKEYLDTIANSVKKKNKTVGAGIFRIAKISHAKFDYSFEKINDNLVYFDLKTVVKIS